ncbi:hypothetical protein [Gandjariella thermophila]|uniref:Ig-like domain-containing protein n=1 Tax=Gandjariella thermophila TaxID=1931992 RepID=A0A4D4JBA2_9PSEU|nr:hypothetical protein [Gandjariella thermophila]GDY32290.1 hypothetical protein GTS_39230 [Gandjariella thermophila]
MSTSVRRWPPTSTALAGVTLALLLAGCGASPDQADNVAKRGITFAVDGQGTADITWSGGTASHATLPWHTTVQEPVGAHPVSLTVVLGQQGGQATCSISVDGHRVSSSLAQGAYGRATCHASTTTGSPRQPDA